MNTHRRLPISARHAFALAFDLAVRRDPIQSLWVPLLLHAPWLVASMLLPVPSVIEEFTRGRVALHAAIAVGETVTWLTIGAMLRFRARSVFNTPAGIRPAPVGECYARGFRRIGWLYLCELLRYAMLVVAMIPIVLPGVCRLGTQQSESRTRDGGLVRPRAAAQFREHLIPFDDRVVVPARRLEESGERFPQIGRAHV